MEHEILLLKLITLIGNLLKWVKDLSNFFHNPFPAVYDLYLTKLIRRYYLSYQIIFVLNFFIVFLLMKITSWSLLAGQRPALFEFLFCSPLLSARVYLHSHFQKESLRIIGLKLLLSLMYLGLIIWLARHLLLPLSYWKIVLISPMIYLFTEFLGAFGQLVFYPSKKGIAPIHFHPLRSRNLGEFWGKRWNFWVSDWLRDISLHQRKKPVKKILITFFVSGLFHELLVNLPYLLVYRESFFGNMTLYFAIQGLGLWIEKKYLQKAPLPLRILFMWMIVLLPSPLFLSRPLWIFFGIMNG